jgi:hypothetical protein
MVLMKNWEPPNTDMYPNDGRLQEFRLLDCVNKQGAFLLPAMIAISFGEKQFQNPAYVSGCN